MYSRVYCVYSRVYCVYSRVYCVYSRVYFVLGDDLIDSGNCNSRGIGMR